MPQAASCKETEHAFTIILSTLLFDMTRTDSNVIDCSQPRFALASSSLAIISARSNTCKQRAVNSLRTSFSLAERKLRTFIAGDYANRANTHWIFSRKSDPKVFVEDRQARTGSNCGRSFCIEFSVKSLRHNVALVEAKFSTRGTRADSYWVDMPNGTGNVRNFQMFGEKDNLERLTEIFKTKTNFFVPFDLKRNFRKFWSNGTRPLVNIIVFFLSCEGELNSVLEKLKER